MLDIKKIKKKQIDLDIADVQVRMAIGKNGKEMSRQTFHNKMNYITEFNIREAIELCKLFNCQIDDIMHEDLEEYEMIKEEKLNNI